MRSGLNDLLENQPQDSWTRSIIERSETSSRVAHVTGVRYLIAENDPQSSGIRNLDPDPAGWTVRPGAIGARDTFPTQGESVAQGEAPRRKGESKCPCSSAVLQVNHVDRDRSEQKGKLNGCPRRTRSKANLTKTSSEIKRGAALE